MHLKLTKPEQDVKVNCSAVLITADGSSLPDDLERWKWLTRPVLIDQILAWRHDVYCVGRSIQHDLVTEVDHWGDIDADYSAWFAGNLPEKARNGHIYRHTLGECKGFDVDWDIVGSMWNLDDVVWHGSSALFAVMTCQAMGYEKIILAGAPLDSKGHWYLENSKGPKWSGESYQAWFEFARLPASKNVKSLSGYTGQLLGVPTEEWIHGDNSN